MIRKYLKEHWKRIRAILAVTLVLTVLTGAVSYRVLSKRQFYTSKVTIEYINAAAKDGYAPDGTKIEPDKEIRGAEVLSKAITASGIDTTAEALASKLTVEPVIPDDEQDKIDAARKNGNTDYTYIPVEYTVTLAWDTEDCSRLLSDVIKSYMAYFAENHVIRQQLPSDPASVLTGDEDYITAADTLLAGEESMETYLTAMTESYGDFRCADNGYAWQDVLDRLTWEKDNGIAGLYAYILSNKASKDPALLVQTLKNENQKAETDNKSCSADLDEVVSLIKSYSEKNRADQGTASSDDTNTRLEIVGGSQDTSGESDDTNAIDKNRTNISDWVYYNTVRPKTTYDTIFQRYMSERDQSNVNDTETDWRNFLIDTFDGVDAVSDAGTKEAIEAAVSSVQYVLSGLYRDITVMNAQEDLVIAGQNIRMLNTPVLTNQVRVKFYTAVAMAAVFILCVVAVPLLHELRRHLEKYLEEEGKVRETKD